MTDLLLKIFHKNLALVLLAVMAASMYAQLEPLNLLPAPDTATSVPASMWLGLKYFMAFAFLTWAAFWILAGVSIVLGLADELLSKGGHAYATGGFITSSIALCLYFVYYTYTKLHALVIPSWMFGYLALVSIVAQANNQSIKPTKNP